MTLTPLAAIAISVGFIVGGWLIYNTLCQILKGRDTLLAAIIFIFVMLCDWILFQLFSARAAYLHVGVMIGSIMVANVFFYIIPGQKSMVAEIRAGQTPDPKYGIIGKQRSVHNTYFTLPVLFIMVSNHYPMTYSHENGWMVLGFIMMAGVLIRQFFVMRHGGNANKALPAIGIVLLLAMVAYLMPSTPKGNQSTSISDAQMQQVVNTRCIACHAQSPTHPGFVSPPLGVILETIEQIEQHAVKIATTVQTRYMPLGNLTHMTDDERALIASWYAQTLPAQ